MARTRSNAWMRWTLSVTLITMAAAFKWSDSRMPVAGAARVLTVDRLDDHPGATACAEDATNDCSLRGAILAANALGGGPTTIVVPAGTYILSQPSSCSFKNAGSPTVNTTSQLPLCLTANIIVRGADAATTIIDAAEQVAPVIFVSEGASAELANVTIRNGRNNLIGVAMAPGGGGVNNQGQVRVIDSVIRNNMATHAGGGGIYNAGALSLLRTTVLGNSAPLNLGQGGGISNSWSGTVTIEDSLIAGNVAISNGGGVSNFQGTVSITGSTVSENTSEQSLGGGIFVIGGNFVGRLTVVNSTISGNRSGSIGGGLYAHHLTDVHLNNVTIANNRSANVGGGLGKSDGTLTLRNSIIAGNRDVGGRFAAPDCEARTPANQVTSEGYNLVQDASNCVLGGVTDGNITGVDPLLEPLGNYGGPTPTQALGRGSAAIDAANPADPGRALACAAIDQRGLMRPEGERCDIGATEHRAGFALTGVAPHRAGNTGHATVTIFGGGFTDAVTVKLAGSGLADLVPTSVTVAAGGDVISASFQLQGTPVGARDVVVTNSDGATRSLTNAFRIESGGAPDLWVDVVASPVVRPARSSRVFVYFGNRGTVDAIGVPLTLSIPAPLTWTLRFSVLPPAPHAQQTPLVDWNPIPLDVAPDVRTGGLSNIPLFLPVVSAGSQAILEVDIAMPRTFPPGPLTPLLAAINDPIFTPTLRVSALEEEVQSARNYAQAVLGQPIPEALAPAIRGYISAQLDAILREGYEAFTGGLGTTPQVYSRAWMQFDASAFAIAQKLHSTSLNPQLAQAHTPRLVAALHAIAKKLPYRLAARSVAAQQQNCSVKRGDPLPPGCSQTDDGKVGPPPLPLPPGCDPDEINKKLSTPGGMWDLFSKRPDCRLTPAHCESLPGHKVMRTDDGNAYCVPKNPTKECPEIHVNLPSSSVVSCGYLPLTNFTSQDPNDKSGSVGVASARFITGGTPLNYVVQFENTPTATAPAQEVVVTDVLDPARVDLATFQLGPIAFGRHRAVPAPGVREYIASIDLRPEQNLLVLIRAGLDLATSTVTWRLKSVDPGTLEFPADPLAGFLPPNLHPPAGDGSLVFSVQPKAGVRSGTVICNRARIVFDTNAAIETPEWCNTIDRTAPVSHVLPLPPTTSTSTFDVRWSGSDAAGVSRYSVFVSEDGGPFTALLAGTSETSVAFNGRPGHAYAFFSTATDVVGHVEARPAVPDAVTRVGDAGDACATDVSARVSVTRSGFRRSTVTGRFVQTVTMRNISSQPIEGPVALAFDGLSGVTLFGASGQSSCGLAGSPLLPVASNPINVGSSIAKVVEFVNPSAVPISYTLRVLAGSGHQEVLVSTACVSPQELI